MRFKFQVPSFKFGTHEAVIQECREVIVFSIAKSLDSIERFEDERNFAQARRAVSQ